MNSPAATASRSESEMPVRRASLASFLCAAVPYASSMTGSETTLAAVITDADTHHKYAINDFNLIPDYAVLEPSVTYGLPPQLTATTGMDALTHAIEAYIGRSTTKQTRSAAVEAIQLIFDNLQNAYNNGNDKTARHHMLRASYLAGTAIRSGSLCQIFKMPSILERDLCGRASLAPTAFAQSMEEPPPNARSA